MDRRHEQAARNESVFRLANEAIDVAAHRFGTDKGMFVCECSHADCAEMIELRLDEYEAIRAHGDRFAIVGGHEDREVERVVEQNARFSVVEKVGYGQEVARRLDPRA
ncbi:MAG: hypothetical protein M3M94_02030 [Actinomycetota bacterium]|nr:hypothetical protein [Actinomycetota bacterium]